MAQFSTLPGLVSRLAFPDVGLLCPRAASVNTSERYQDTCVWFSDNGKTPLTLGICAALPCGLSVVPQGPDLRGGTRTLLLSHHPPLPRAV